MQTKDTRNAGHLWPRQLDWKQLGFGVELEFASGRPEELDLLPGWTMALDERQVDGNGDESGSELQSPPLRWEERGQILLMLHRLRAQGAEANWSCGLHVHIGLEPWGEAMVEPLLEAALRSQDALQALLRTSGHRRLFCPPVLPEMAERYRGTPGRKALRYRNGRPQSHRCGINTAAWYDNGTVEIRYANGSLDDEEVCRTVELCLRWVAAVGAGVLLPGDPEALASSLDVPLTGYPPPVPPPRWFRERTWLEEELLPMMLPLAGKLVPGGEVHHILPGADGFLLAVEDEEGKLSKYIVQPPADGWRVRKQLPAETP